MVSPAPVSIELAAALCILLSGAPGCLWRRAQGVLQRGPVHTYLLYVVLAVVSVLLVAR